MLNTWTYNFVNSSRIIWCKRYMWFVVSKKRRFSIHLGVITNNLCPKGWRRRGGTVVGGQGWQAIEETEKPPTLVAAVDSAMRQQPMEYGGLQQGERVKDRWGKNEKKKKKKELQRHAWCLCAFWSLNFYSRLWCICSIHLCAQCVAVKNGLVPARIEAFIT